MSIAITVLDYWDSHTSDGRCKYPRTCEIDGTHEARPIRETSGYDWILNRCVDLEQAEHAAHLDEGHYLGDCSYCREGAGRQRIQHASEEIRDA